MEGGKVGGIILGVIGLLFLLYPVAVILYNVIAPSPPSDDYISSRFAGAFIGMLFYTIPGAIFVGLSKLRLKRSIVFGALFIIAGALNFYIWTGTFYLSGSLNLLLYAPPLIAILVGVSLIVPLGKLAR